MATEEETKTALPPYPEMIVAAIKALNEESGSSKTAISKHIESEHGDLPAGHATLLAHHLNKMKSNGELVLANDSYKLPDPNTPAKRGRGRPPKPKTPGTPASVKTTSPKPRGRPPKPKDPASESAKKAASGTPKRGRGRPPKEGGSATPSAKKAKTSKPAASPASTPGSKRGRGRPPKVKPEAATNVVMLVAINALNEAYVPTRHATAKVLQFNGDLPGLNAPVKKSRGRPKKHAGIIGTVASAVAVPAAPGETENNEPVFAIVPATPHTAAALATPSLKKGRGRPPKVNLEAATPANPGVKSRGRPPKVKSEAATPVTSGVKSRGWLPKVKPEATTPATSGVKSRGRPPQVKHESAIPATSGVERKRGRPPKVKSEAATPATSGVNRVRGRGRPPR